MKISEIELHQFRNYENLRLELKSGVNLFLGDNGQGKTNLLEAIHIALKGDSFRPGASANWLRRDAVGAGTDRAAIFAQMNRARLTNDLKVTLESGHRRITLDNKRVRSDELLHNYPLVLFSPESLSSIKDGPEARRQLVDDFIRSQMPAEAGLVGEFRRALRQRNSLLRDIGSGLIAENDGLQILSALDEIYLPLATALTNARLKALSILQPLISHAVSYVTDGEIVDISVDYVASNSSLQDQAPDEVAKIISNRLKTLRKSELSTATSLVGPHKHEINFVSGGKDARYYFSQGQQRALILGFKMAQIMYHQRVFQVHPILLLDDVLSELDPKKGAKLLAFLSELNSQILLTSTDISFSMDLSKSDSRIFRVDQGKITEL